MKVFIYVLNTLADWEISYLICEITSKRYFKNKATDCTIVKVGNSTKEEIRTMGGLVIQPDISIHDFSLNQEDILVLPGAETWFDKDQDDILNFAKEEMNKNHKVAAICGGTIGLARFGLLNNRKHTSNSKYYLTEFVPEYKGSSNFIEQPVINDNNLITASGLSPIEFTYETIKTLGVWSDETLDAWKNLYNKKDEQSYYQLMSSLK